MRADHRSNRNGAGSVTTAGNLHTRQRPSGGGDPRSPHAGGHADDLVQGRFRRRDPGEIRAGAFSRTPDVQGHRRASGGRILPAHRPHRRQRERLHLLRLHRLFPARVARPACHHDGIRGRSHDRPHSQGRERAARARRGARRIQHARRQQPRCAADRTDHGGAVPQSPLRTADHRLAPGNREAQPRGRARLLQALLRAEQRDPYHRRRRQRRRGPSDGGKGLRQDSAAASDPGAAHPSAGADAGSTAHRDAVRSPRRAAECAPLLSRSLLGHRGPGRKLGAGSAGATDGLRQQFVSLSRAGGGQAARGQRRRLVPGHGGRSDAVRNFCLAETRRRIPAGRAGHRRRDRKARDGFRTRRRPRTHQDADDRRVGLCAGQPDHAGALVWRRHHRRSQRRRCPGMAGPHPRGHRRTGARRGADMAREKRSVTGYLIKDTTAATANRGEKRS